MIETWRNDTHTRLYQEVAGAVIHFRYQREHLRELVAASPADHYFLVEDKPDVVQTVKRTLGNRLTTVFVRQGKYAAALVVGDPEPDIMLERMAGFADLDLGALVQGAAYVAG